MLLGDQRFKLMRIPSPNNQPSSALGQLSAAVAGNAISAPGPQATQQQGSDQSTDNVQLSKMSSYLSNAVDGSPAHLQKLSDLQAAVGTGQYQVDALHISGSIIQHSIELGGLAYGSLTT